MSAAVICVSTGGVPGQPAADTAREFAAHGISAIELSGGEPSDDQLSALRAMRSDVTLRMHNYFPPPPVPFVFNLASPDPAIGDRSMAHVRTALEWANDLGCPVYGFHAGFRLDPTVGELGRSIATRALTDRAVAFEIFRDRVGALAEDARRAGVRLLVENNVVSAGNLARFGEDPLLLSEPGEIARFFEQAPSNVGLLLDVAHLRVSATSLQFDAVQAHDRVRQWIAAYHLSENDGTSDTNDPIHDESWFWEVLDPHLDYYSLEVYRVSATELRRQQALAEARVSAMRTRRPTLRS